MEFRNTTNGNYARIIKQAEKEFILLMGYETKSFEAYGNETITNRKVFKSEKAAIKKAEQYVN